MISSAFSLVPFLPESRGVQAFKDLKFRVEIEIKFLTKKFLK